MVNLERQLVAQSLVRVLESNYSNYDQPGKIAEEDTNDLAYVQVEAVLCVGDVVAKLLLAEFVSYEILEGVPDGRGVLDGLQRRNKILFLFYLSWRADR